MSRIKYGKNTRRRHNKVLKQAKGFRGAGSRLFRTAKVAVDRALWYAYRDRKVRKRDFRALWVQRINAAARQNGTTYSRFIGALNKLGVGVDRKILAELAISDPQAFSKLVELSKTA